MFSLTNQDNQPCKLRQIHTTQSICCASGYGPTFGLNDILICNNANTTMGTHSNLGYSYQHPQPSQGQSYLAGSYNFYFGEIEVYQKE